MIRPGAGWTRTGHWGSRWTGWRFALALLAAMFPPMPAAAEFILNNLRFTLYHEVGHAVIDQYSVPIFGPEEAVADGFALVIADRLHTEAEMRDMIEAVTTLGRSQAGQVYDPWAGYMPDGQRVAWTICIWFGLNPSGRGDFARALGMPPGAAEDCAYQGRTLRAAWRPVLDRAKPKDGADPTLTAAAKGKALRMLGPDIARLNAMVALPRQTPITVERCGEDNAYYYVEGRIVICTEMMEGLRARRP